jgi:hypothetical protein
MAPEVSVAGMEHESSPVRVANRENRRDLPILRRGRRVAPPEFGRGLARDALEDAVE